MKRLEPVKRLPVLVFLTLVISLGIAGYALFQFAIVKHSRGEYFYLVTKELEFEFPKNWSVFTQEFSNESGEVYYIAVYPPATHKRWVSILLVVYDERFTEFYMERHGLTNTSQALLFEAERTYNDIKRRNEYANMNLTERGTLNVSGVEATYLLITFRDGYVDNDGDLHNLTVMFLSWTQGTSQGEKTYYLIFYGVEEEWSQIHIQRIFEHLLNTLKMSGSKDGDG